MDDDAEAEAERALIDKGVIDLFEPKASSASSVALDPIQAILSKNGVGYGLTHTHQLGGSRVEAGPSILS